MLTGPDGIGFARAVLAGRGERMISSRLDQVDHEPGNFATVLHSCQVAGEGSRRMELVGLTWRAAGLNSSDAAAELFHDADREVAAWVYPDDPDLPGLASATIPDAVRELLVAQQLIPSTVDAAHIKLRMVSYRPRRRAVVRVAVHSTARRWPTSVFFLKAFTAADSAPALQRLEILARAGLPVARLLAATTDHLAVLAPVEGRPMARRLFDERPSVTGERLVELLDAMPAEIAALPARAPWPEGVQHYARLVAGQLPQEAERAHQLADDITDCVASALPGDEATHGDFHEGQIYVAAHKVSGLLDVEAAGPGRRVDDLACMIAHLRTVHSVDGSPGADAGQIARVESLTHGYLAAFDGRVDPADLRIRAAAVALSLATGPFSEQDPQWPRHTSAALDAAQRLMREAADV